MFVQFFKEASLQTRAIAWMGMWIVLAYSAFAAYTKAQLNAFFDHFYNLVQRSGALMIDIDEERGSGEASASFASFFSF